MKLKKRIRNELRPILHENLKTERMDITLKGYINNIR